MASDDGTLYTRLARAGEAVGSVDIGGATLNRILKQVQAFAHQIQVPASIEPPGLLERALARLLMAAYRRRLRAIVRVVPTWVSEEILSASEHIRDDRPVPWMSKN
jgi:hypothetical protein